MGCYRILILPHGSLLGIEAWETEHLLLEDTEVLIGELAHEELLGIARIAGILITVFHRSHTHVELLLGNTQGLAELHRIKTVTRLIHHHHNVVRRLVIHNQLPMTIGDITT